MSYVRSVISAGKFTVCLAGGLLLAFGLSAAAPSTNTALSAVEAGPAMDEGTEGPPVEAVAPSVPVSELPPNPYQAIITRNPFGLKPPAPSTPTTDQPPAIPESALKLSGITVLGGNKRAMFVLQEPGKPPVNSDLVRENEKDPYIPNLEVRQIDDKAGAVRVVFAGKELNLTFAQHGLKPQPGPALPAVGQPGTVRPGVPQPGMPPVLPLPGQARSPGVATASFQPGQPASVLSSGDVMANPSSLRNIPFRPTRLPTDGGAIYAGGGYPQPQAQPQVQPIQPVVSVEQQIETMRGQKIQADQAGIPMPPLPPGVDPAQTTPTVPGQQPGQLPRIIPLPPFPGGNQ